MHRLETLLRRSRPEWPAPPAEAEERLLAALGLADPPPAAAPAPRRRRRRPRARLLAVAALVAASGAALGVALVGRSGTAPAGAPAALAFAPPEVVGRMTFDGSEDVAVDAAGTTTVVWSRAGRVVVATRPRDGRWSAPRRLSDPARRAARPRVAAGPAGTAVVIWRERDPGRRVSADFVLPGGAPAGTLEADVGVRWSVVARARDGGGDWGPAQAVAPSTGALRDVYAPQLVMSAAGEATVGLVGGGRVLGVSRRPGGSWGAPIALGRTAGAPLDLQLAVHGPSGWRIAAWSARTTDAREGRRVSSWAAVAPPGGTWTAPAPGAPPAGGRRLVAAAVGASGAAVVAWAERGVRAVVREPGGGWSAPVTAIPAPGRGGDLLDAPAVGIDRGGALVAAVVTPLGGGARSEPPPGALAARLDLDGAPTPPRSLGPHVGRVAIVPDAAGGLLLVGPTAGPPGSLRVTATGPSGRPRGATRVRIRSFLPRIAAGADGTVAIVGLRSRRDGAAVVVAVAPGGRP